MLYGEVENTSGNLYVNIWLKWDIHLIRLSGVIYRAYQGQDTDNYKALLEWWAYIYEICTMEVYEWVKMEPYGKFQKKTTKFNQLP